MSTLSLRLPESLHRRLSEVAKKEGISINQLINSAVAEKMSALMTAEYLDARAERGSRRKFDAVLAKVANIEPADVDRLPPSDAERSPRKRRGSRR
jgi:predicted transcriptional regulator